MPLYDYHCNQCEYEHEFLIPVEDRDYPIQCPECELGLLYRIVQNKMSFKLKGECWSHDGYKQTHRTLKDNR